MRSLTYGELIRGNRNFRNLLAGQFISELGNWFNFIAGLGLVRVASEASPKAAGILFVCRILPFGLFSPIAGTFVDRFSRRTVMIISDLLRVAIALAFLLVSSADDLWIAYSATVLLSAVGAFFEGAKNAAAPNLTGKEGLLAGTALMFSTRFLLMAVGSALGGWAAYLFGYQIAFIINAASFLISAYTVWLIPEEAVAEKRVEQKASVLLSEPGATVEPLRNTGTYSAPEPTGFPLPESGPVRESFIGELKEGFRYAVGNRFAFTILIMNIIWATGGGAINIIFERMGGVYFAARESWNPDVAVALLWTASGFGLFGGMMIAHRTSSFLERTGTTRAFVGWTLVIHGILFAIGGLMPTLLLFCLFAFVSRSIVGVEYAIQETLFQRSLPDRIRGRISTLDRGAELTMFSLSSYVGGELMFYITPQALTVASGILSAAAGLVWFVREKPEKKHR